SSATWWITHPTESPFAAGRVATRTIANHVARRWDDPRECAAYLDRVRDTIGLELRVVRDPSRLPRPQATMHGGGLAFDGRGHALGRYVGRSDRGGRARSARAPRRDQPRAPVAARPRARRARDRARAQRRTGGAVVRRDRAAALRRRRDPRRSARRRARRSV